MSVVRLDVAGVGQPDKDVRSRNYPALPLDAAIERARQFYTAERRSAAPIAAAAKHWGISEKSSNIKLTVAALIHFGLLQNEGSSEDRLVRLTPRALDIVLGEPESHSWDNAVMDALLSPKIYQEIFSKWPLDELPSDQTLKHYLVRDLSFNGNAVDSFIRNFRSSLAFLGLRVRNEKSKVDVVSVPEVTEDKVGSNPTVVETLNLPWTPSGLPGLRTDTFSLEEGNVVLQCPTVLSPTSYEDLKDWMEGQLRKVGRQVKQP